MNFNLINSSINRFYVKDRVVLFSTSNKDIAAPIIPELTQFKNTRPTYPYDINKCQHSFMYVDQIQKRRGDEAPNILEKCTKCDYSRIL